MSLPKDEVECLMYHLKLSKVILEYGSGDTTIAASKLREKLIFSVESDRNWAVDLQCKIDEYNSSSHTLIYHVNIGPTGKWGRPIDSTNWHKFYKYSLSIWDEPFFKQPDVVFIDGRFRPACLMATILRTKKKITVLFDDYVNRDYYHNVEQFVVPKTIVGRMAVFEIKPDQLNPKHLTSLMSLFFQSTYAKC